MQLPDAQALADQLMQRHELYDQGWSFSFDQAKVRFGVCKHYRKQITISRYLVELNDEPEVRDVILHEIAHAIAGHSAGHGRQWQRIAADIGAKPERCYSTANVATPEAAFIGTCPSCSREIKRHRRNKLACGTCCRKHNAGKFSPEYLFTWQRAAISK